MGFKFEHSSIVLSFYICLKWPKCYWRSGNSSALHCKHKSKSFIHVCYQTQNKNCKRKFTWKLCNFNWIWINLNMNYTRKEHISCIWNEKRIKRNRVQNSDKQCCCWVNSQHSTRDFVIFSFSLSLWEEWKVRPVHFITFTHNNGYSWALEPEREQKWIEKAKKKHKFYNIGAWVFHCDG